jgi:O-antigen/teichoic acid export membrane protein
MFLTVILDMGVSTVVLRRAGSLRHAPQKDLQIIRSAFSSAWLQAAAVMGFSLAFGLLAFSGELGSWYLVAIAIWSGSERAFETLLAGLISQKQVARGNVLVLAKRLAPLVVQLWLLNQGMTGTEAFGWAMISGVIAGVLSVLGVRLAGAMRLAAPFRYPFRESLDYWVAATSSQARELETPLVHTVAGPLEAGLYSVAAKIQKPLAVFSVSMAQIVLPRVAQNESTVRRELRVILISSALAVAGALALLPWTGPLTSAVFGPEYQGAVPVIQISLISAVPFAFTSPVGAILQAVEQGRFVATVGVVAAAIATLALVLGATIGGAELAAICVGVIYTLKFAIVVGRAWRIG